MSSKRRKAFVLPREYALMLFNNRFAITKYAHFSANAPEIPQDAKILDLHYSHDRQAFKITCSHPSFEEVPDGCETPVVDGLFAEITLVEIDRTEREKELRKELDQSIARTQFLTQQLRDLRQPVTREWLNQLGFTRPKCGFADDVTALQRCGVELIEIEDCFWRMNEYPLPQTTVTRSDVFTAVLRRSGIDYRECGPSDAADCIYPSRTS